MAAPESIDAVLTWAMDSLEAPARPAALARLARSAHHPFNPRHASLPFQAGVALASFAAFLAPMSLFPAPALGSTALSLCLAAAPMALIRLGRGAELIARLAPSAARQARAQGSGALASFSAAVRQSALALRSQGSPAWATAAHDAKVRAERFSLSLAEAVARSLPGAAAQRAARALTERLRSADQRWINGFDSDAWSLRAALGSLRLAEPAAAADTLYRNLALDRLAARERAPITRRVCATPPVSSRERALREAISEAAPFGSRGPNPEMILDLMERLALDPLRRPRPDLPTLLEMIETHGQERPTQWDPQSPWLAPRIEALRARAEAATLSEEVPTPSAHKSARGAARL